MSEKTKEEKKTEQNLENSKNEQTNSPKTKNGKGKGKRKFQKFIYVNVTQAYYPLIQEAMEKIGYRITDNERKTNLFWINQNGSIDTASDLLPYQFYNHFPGTVAISRKVDCARNLEAVANIMPEAYSFNPKSFIMPTQYNDLKNYMLSIKNPKQRTFIIKPDKGSLGKGIILVQDPSHLENYTQNAIAQKYIEPYLIDGLKFDLRIYVLITSIEPLRIYVHDEGMARFCTESYEEPNTNNLDQVFRHLTNYSLNKKNDHFQANEIVNEEETGHKRSMTSIFESIKKDGHDIEKLKHQIDEVLRLTIASAQHYIASQYRIGCTINDGKSRCFEILGFDIMIDKDCKPWLIEVNNKPSMAAESEFDHTLKLSVIQGAMKIINLQPNFKKHMNNRLKELSQARSQDPKTSLKFYDPEGESKRAKETKWRQLYPLLEGDVSEIEKGLAAARQANGLKPRKDSQFSPTPPLNLPQNSNLQQNQASQNQTQLQKKIQSQRQSAKRIKTTSHKIVRPVQKNDKAIQSNILQSPPPKIINRMSTTTKYTLQKQDEIPTLIQMRDLPPNIIDEEEEKERIRNIRKQAVLACSVSCLQRVRAMLSIVGTMPKRQENIQQPSFPHGTAPFMSIQQTQVQQPQIKPERILLNRPFPLKQFNLTDLVF